MRTGAVGFVAGLRLKVALSLVVALSLIGPASAATLTVDLNGSADYADIQSAIDAASDGDTVLVMPGEYAIAAPIDFNPLYDPYDPASPPLRTLYVISEAGADATAIQGVTPPPEESRVPVVALVSSKAGENSILDGFRLSGGQVGLDEGTGIVRNCRIEGNETGVHAINTGAPPTLIDCTIAENRYGIECTRWCSLDAMRCRIERNAQTGVYVYRTATNLVSCVIADNGGAGLIAEECEPVLWNCTVARNAGSGIACPMGGASLVNCIVWGNALSVESEDPTTVEILHSSIEGSPVWPGEGNINLDPEFSAPQSGDYRLAATSPCIDAGEAEGAPGTDIDGHARPCGAGVDMGAYELGDCGPATPFERGDANADATFDISDPVATLGFLFLGSAELTCLDAADVNDDGIINITDAIYSLGFLFLGESAPPAPFGACGRDETADHLACAVFAPCRAGL